MTQDHHKSEGLKFTFSFPYSFLSSVEVCRAFFPHSQISTVMDAESMDLLGDKIDVYFGFLDILSDYLILLIQDVFASYLFSLSGHFSC